MRKEQWVSRQICVTEHVHGIACYSYERVNVPPENSVNEEVSLLHEDPTRSEDAQEELTGDSVARPREGNVREIPRPVPADFPGVRECLVQALAEYDRGELVGIAIIKEFRDTLGSSHSGTRMMLLAGCSRLEHFLNQQIDEN